MSKKRRTNVNRDRPQQKRSAAFLVSSEAYDILCGSGYTRLDQNPEIITGCRKIADMISSMTIHLMENRENGDRRIQNELSRKVDIEPCQYMTRKTWMDAIVMNLLLYGKGNSVVIPRTENGMLRDMVVTDASTVSFLPMGYGYKVQVNGTTYDPGDVLHFVWNPDPHYPWKGQGMNVAMRDVAKNLRQATETKNAFMSSKWKPSIIVKVDGMTEEFSSPEGRSRLIGEYLQTARDGEPWMIPADQFEVVEVKPLSLADLSLNDAVEIDKRMAASIIGVPPFVLGVGDYTAEAWDAFVSNTIRPLAQMIEQELTKKLLTSPKWYWKFNVASLYSYNLQTTANVYGALYDKGIVAGNEVRDKISMPTIEGLEKVLVLENYIPVDKVGEQKKLQQGEME